MPKPSATDAAADRELDRRVRDRLIKTTVIVFMEIDNRYKIVSGGQTGVDRGALDAALELGFPCGGWCPEGRLADDGEIAERYPLEVLAGSGYRKRTRQNVLDSDGTVIIYFEHIYPKGGTEQTLLECIKAHKPYLLIDAEELTEARAGERIAQFAQQKSLKVINIAGPKARGVAQAYEYTRLAIRAFLSTL